MHKQQLALALYGLGPIFNTCKHGAELPALASSANQHCWHAFGASILSHVDCSRHSCPFDALTTTVQRLWLCSSAPFDAPKCSANLQHHCVQDLEAGPIKSVHFSQVAKTPLEGAHTLEEDYFSAPDFVVGTRTGSIVAVRSGSFEETSSDVPPHRLLVQVPPNAMHSMHSMNMPVVHSRTMPSVHSMTMPSMQSVTSPSMHSMAV